LKVDVEERGDESIQPVEFCKVVALAGHETRFDWQNERVLPTRLTDASGRGPGAKREEVGG